MPTPSISLLLLIKIQPIRQKDCLSYISVYDCILISLLVLCFVSKFIKLTKEDSEGISTKEFSFVFLTTPLTKLFKGFKDDLYKKIWDHIWDEQKMPWKGCPVPRFKLKRSWKNKLQPTLTKVETTLTKVEISPGEWHLFIGGKMAQC